MDPLTLAYLAGVIDSDGCISTQRTKYGDHVYFAPRVSIAGTRRNPHDLAASFFGGSVYRYVPKNPRHRPQFQWSRTGEGAANVLEELVPYLRIKKRQAQLGLDLFEVVAVAPHLWPTTLRGQMEGLHEEIRALNQSRH